MAKSVFQNILIKGMSIVLGENKKNIDSEPQYYGGDTNQLLRLKKNIGFNERYWANQNTTTCDLCEAAAKKLLNKLNISVETLDGIIFVTQTPDYYMPGNAHIIHKNLGCNNRTIAMDLEFGCSGYIYGLWTAFMMINSGLKKILLLTGDTLSKVVNQNDKTEAPLFGDAGSATIIEYSDIGNFSYFVLNSDGCGFSHMLQPAGAYRQPSNQYTRKEIEYSKGVIRSLENIYMNGFEIFNFTMTEQPKLLNEILSFSGASKEDIDYFIFHQANTYIVETIMKKSKISPEKCPTKVFSKYGNQNSASIPSTICSELSNKLKVGNFRILMQGFGIGLSWGACITDFRNIICLEPSIYGEKNV